MRGEESYINSTPSGNMMNKKNYMNFNNTFAINAASGSLDENREGIFPHGSSASKNI